MTNNPSRSGAEVGLPGGNFRWTICGLLFFSVAVNYLDGFTGMILQKTGSYVFAYFSGMYLLSLLAIQVLVPWLEPERKN